MERTPTPLPFTSPLTEPKEDKETISPASIAVRSPLFVTGTPYNSMSIEDLTGLEKEKLGLTITLQEMETDGTDEPLCNAMRTHLIDLEEKISLLRGHTTTAKAPRFDLGMNMDEVDIDAHITSLENSVSALTVIVTRIDHRESHMVTEISNDIRAMGTDVTAVTQVLNKGFKKLQATNKSNATEIAAVGKLIQKGDPWKALSFIKGSILSFSFWLGVVVTEGAKAAGHDAKVVFLIQFAVHLIVTFAIMSRNLGK